MTEFTKPFCLATRVALMDQSFTDLVRSNRIVRGSIAVAGTLFLGALGSGLWELALKNSFLWLGNVVLSAVVLVWGGYVDVLHESIGKLHQDLLVIPLFAVCVVGILAIPWLMILTLLRELSKIGHSLDEPQKRDSTPSLPERIRRIRSKTVRILVPLSLISTLIVAITVWQTLYTRTASNWSEQSIEIVAPHLSDVERLKLRAELRQVNTAAKFYRLHSGIVAAAASAGVSLPKFTPIGKSGGG